MRATSIVSCVTLAMLSLPARAQPSIGVTPPDVVEGEPVHIVVTGLQAGQTVTLRATQRLPGNANGDQDFEGSASFVADAKGNVDLRSSRPLAGSSYDRADAAGLFWSMAPVRKVASPPAGPAGTQRDHLAGDVAIELESAGKTVARAIARIRPAAETVTLREVREPGVTGVFARDRSTARQPAIIVLGGSEGGLSTANWAAPLLASYGYSVLGLGYFQSDEPGLAGLPANLERIPLETLSRARDWLVGQPGVDTTRIAVVGVSKGAELALTAAANFPWITVVGAFAPSHVVWEGIPLDYSLRTAASSWTFKGQPLPHVRWSWSAADRSDLSRAATGSSRLTEVHLESLTEFASDVEAARIPIERSGAAIFIAAGTDDGMWPSAFSAEQLRLRLAQRDPTATAVFEIHPTGHLILGSGWAPTTLFQRSTGRLPGGNPRLDAEAQKIIWPAFLAFLNKHLRDGLK